MYFICLSLTKEFEKFTSIQNNVSSFQCYHYSVKNCMPNTKQMCTMNKISTQYIVQCTARYACTDQELIKHPRIFGARKGSLSNFLC
jgi:hypothetical protein